MAGSAYMASGLSCPGWRPAFVVVVLARWHEMASEWHRIEGSVSRGLYAGPRCPSSGGEGFPIRPREDLFGRLGDTRRIGIRLAL
jgi:hypothetical protein